MSCYNIAIDCDLSFAFSFPKGRFTNSMPCPCRGHAVPLPCRSAKGLECVYIIFINDARSSKYQIMKYIC